MPRAVTAAAFAVLGLICAVAGIRMSASGTSWPYLFASAGLLWCAWLLFTERRLVFWAFAVVAISSLLWLLVEVGPVWRKIAPPAVLASISGIWLLLPWATRGMVLGGTTPEKATPPLWRGHALPVTVSVAFAAVIAATSAAVN